MSTTTLPGHDPPPAFSHEALLYRGEGQFLDACVPFLRDGVAAGEPLLVAVSPAKVALLRDALGADAGRVRWENMTALGRNPGRIIPVWHEFVAEHAGAPGMRGIGEPAWPGRTAVEFTECEQHESLLNVAFDDGPPWRLLCPYDAAGLPSAVVEGARRTHPRMTDPRGTQFSPVYGDHDAAVRTFTQPLPPAPTEAETLAFGRHVLAGLRRYVADRAAAAGLPPARVEDLVTAVNELTTNSLTHGGGRGVLRMWRGDGTVVCEVADAGRMTDPLVGRTPPALERPNGRGLWLAHQLCDLVQVRSNPDGTTVRVHMGVRVQAAA